MSYTTTYAIESGELVIEFDYQREEAATNTYPGCDERVDLVSVKAGDFEILEVIGYDIRARMEETCWEHLLFLNERSEAYEADRTTELPARYAQG